MNGEITYGRSMPKETPQVLLDEQKKSDYGIMAAVKARKNKQGASISGDFIFKDVKIFKPEAIIIVLVSCITMIGYFMWVFLQSYAVNDLKQYMSDTAFTKAFEFMQGFTLMSIVFVAIPIVAMVGIFIFKFMFLHPYGKKRLVIRAWKNNLARISVDTPKDNVLPFEPGDKASEIIIGNERKCTDLDTGTPILVLKEGEPENCYLNETNKNPEKVRDLNNVKKSIWSAATRYQRFIDRKGESFFGNPTNLMLIMVIIIVIVIMVFLFTRQGGSGGLMESAQGVVENLTKRG